MRRLSLFLSIIIIFSIAFTGCNKASVSQPEITAQPEPVSDTPETSVPETDPEPADDSDSLTHQDTESSETAEAPEVSDNVHLTDAFEMYMQYYFENGSIIEIPQIVDSSPTADDINQELRSIGDEYYAKYSDYIGTASCQVVAYPCETEEYLSIVLTCRELPEENSFGTVRSWIYDKSTQSQLVFDLAVDPETIEEAMTSAMEFHSISNIESRATPTGQELYIMVRYSISGDEYEDLFVMRNGQVSQYIEGSLVPSNAVADFTGPLWAKWDENNNGMYDTAVDSDTINSVGDKIISLGKRQLDLTLEESQLTARYRGTYDLIGHKNCLTYVLEYQGADSYTQFGVFFYCQDEDAYYGPLNTIDDTDRIE